MNECYKQYLDYLLGNVSITEPNFNYNKKFKYYKNNQYDIILELADWRLFIKEDIWYNFQYFFDLRYSETMIFFNEYFSKKMNLKYITNSLRYFCYDTLYCWFKFFVQIFIFL
jgi:hypothetical protein